MKDEKILTWHPEGKQGVNLSRARYEQVRAAILDVLAVRSEVDFRELSHLVATSLTGRFDGKVTWYVVTVKLDLEARGLIERVPGARPQRLRLAKS